MNAANERKRTFLTAVDNKGVKRTLTPKDWATHPDTFSTDKKGNKKAITPDQIRHRMYAKIKRGFTDRQIVGLDDVPYMAGKRTDIKKQVDPDAVRDFFKSALVPQ